MDKMDNTPVSIPKKSHLNSAVFCRLHRKSLGEASSSSVQGVFLTASPCFFLHMYFFKETWKMRYLTFLSKHTSIFQLHHEQFFDVKNIRSMRCISKYLFVVAQQEEQRRANKNFAIYHVGPWSNGHWSGIWVPQWSLNPTMA